MILSYVSSLLMCFYHCLGDFYVRKLQELEGVAHEWRDDSVSWLSSRCTHLSVALRSIGEPCRLSDDILESSS
jgi:hypothetical protein